LVSSSSPRSLRKSPRQWVRDRTPSQEGLVEFVLLASRNTSRFTQHQSHLSVLFAHLHHCLQFSALTSHRGGAVVDVPQWDPLTLPETSEVASEFLSRFFNFCSVSRLQTPRVRGVEQNPRQGSPKSLGLGLCS